MCFAKNISKNVSGKYSQKRLDYAIESTTDPLKNCFRKIRKAAGATGDLIGRKIADKIIRVSRGLPQNISEKELKVIQKI